MIDIEARLEHARGRHRELNLALDDFKSMDPVRLEEEVRDGWRYPTIRVVAEPPVEVSLLISEVAYHFRAALDNVVWALVEGHGGTANGQTAFPVVPTEAEWEDRARRQLRGAPRAAQQAIRSLEPWPLGSIGLWNLHRLNIVDKHRMLPVATASARHLLLRNRITGEKDMGIMPRGELVDGTVIRPLPVLGTEHLDLGVGSLVAFSGDVEEFAHQAVRPLVPNAVEAAEIAIATIRNFL